MEEIIHNLSFIKIKNFCSLRNTIKRIRRQATDQKKIFAKDTSDKRAVIQNMQRIHKTQQ